jgi:CHAT domain-containing protein
VAARPVEDSDAPVIVAYGSLHDALIWWRIDGGTCRFGTADPSRVRQTQERLLAAIETGRPAVEARETLYRELLAGPLRSVGPGRPLVLIPDRDLLRMPYAALLDPATGRELVRNHAVSFRTSLLDVLEAPSGGAKPWERRHAEALVVGDPTFDRLAFSLDPLPRARQEATEIAHLYGPRAALLTGAEATVARVRADLPGRSVLHLAMHTYSTPGGAGPALLFAADPATGGSGLVSSDELLSGTSSSLDLVVLSGCSTLGPSVSRSGGLVGLARPFLDRGARAVLGTLWPLDDALARELMTRFHTALLRGSSASEALRTAQLEMVEEHPDEGTAAWAAVQLVGDLPADPTIDEPKRGERP